MEILFCTSSATPIFEVSDGSLSVNIENGGQAVDGQK